VCIGALRLLLLALAAGAYLRGEVRARIPLRDSRVGAMTQGGGNVRLAPLHIAGPAAPPGGDFEEIALVDWTIDGPLPLAERERATCTRFSGSQDGVTGVQDGHVYRFAASPINISKAFQVSRPSLVCATRALESDDERDLALVVGADDGLAAWLNDELVFDRPSGVGATTYPMVAPVHLRRGRSLLTLAVENRPPLDAWSFAAILAPVDTARSRVIQAGTLELLRRAVVSRSEPLEWRMDVFTSDHVLNLSVTNVDGRSVLERRVPSGRTYGENAASLPEGIYVSRMSDGSDSLTEHLMIGDPHQFLTRYETRAEALKGKEGIWQDLDGLMFRFRHLLRSGPESSRDLFWQHKIADLAFELESALRAAEHAERPFLGPGTHLRAFRSKIDDSVQHYMIHIPESASHDAHLGVVIVVPYATEPNRPFLTSAHVALPHAAEIAAAERAGLAILWPSARGNTHGNPIGVADIFEALSAAQAEYSLDADRLYLYGSCAGGRDALLMAERYPSRFAGVAVLSPETERRVIEPSRRDAFFRAHVQDWLVANSPMTFVENLSNMPVMVGHSDLEKVPVAESERFVQRCEKVGVAVRFDRYALKERRPLDGADVVDDLFKFLARQRREPRPSHVRFVTRQLKYGSAYWLRIDARQDAQAEARIEGRRLPDGRVAVSTTNVAAYEIDADALGGAESLFVSTNNDSPRRFSGRGTIRIDLDDAVASAVAKANKTAAVEGPILHVFAEPFAVVEPTHGALAARLGAQSWATRFCDIWEREYFGRCPRMKDFEVTEEDLHARNLILLGDATSNAILEREQASLPIELTDGRLRVGGRDYGQDVGYQIVLPSPVDPKRYLVVLGAVPGGAVGWPDANLPLEAWHDYAVWRQDRFGNFGLLDVGNFDGTWTTTRSASSDGLLARLLGPLH
jgi:hypothetical protein